jgi:hypothetical protein
MMIPIDNPMNTAVNSERVHKWQRDSRENTRQDTKLLLFIEFESVDKVILRLIMDSLLCRFPILELRLTRIGLALPRYPTIFQLE